jgi:hypothetical protein
MKFFLVLIEAAHVVLRVAWPRVDVTTEDVSIKAPFPQKMLDERVAYGDTLTWTGKLKPATGVRLVHAQLDVEQERFQRCSLS